MTETLWIPITPGGTVLFELVGTTEAQAWANLLESAKGMPYDGIAGFKARGYTVVKKPV